MLTAKGPRVVEFNCRFGDPECQVLVVRADDDLVPVLLAVARREPLPKRLAWSEDAAVCVNLVSGGYPGRYAVGRPITGIEDVETERVHVFHAGTAEADGRLVTAGGRVLSVTATAASLPEAIASAYAAVEHITFEGMHFRRDIGTRRRH